MKLPSFKPVVKLLPLLILSSFIFISGCDFFKDLFGKDDPKNDSNVSDTGSLEIGPNGGKSVWIIWKFLSRLMLSMKTIR